MCDKDRGFARCPWTSQERETGMTGKSIIRVDTGTGIFWFIGWLFTIAFGKLIWWQAILALIVWPYFLGLAVR
jgi:hypothetical protein